MDVFLYFFLLWFSSYQTAYLETSCIWRSDSQK